MNGERRRPRTRGLRHGRGVRVRGGSGRPPVVVEEMAVVGDADVGRPSARGSWGGRGRLGRGGRSTPQRPGPFTIDTRDISEMPEGRGLETSLPSKRMRMSQPSYPAPSPSIAPSSSSAPPSPASSFMPSTTEFVECDGSPSPSSSPSPSPVLSLPPAPRRPRQSLRDKGKEFLNYEMPGTRKVSKRQWELLLRFMEINPAIAKGSMRNDSPLAKINTAAKWSKIAARLNSEGAGCTKSHSKWREYWSQQKYNARKKASGLRQQALATGGGPLPAKFVLNDSDERILALLGHVAVYGDPRYPSPSPLPPSPLPPPPPPPPPPDSAAVMMATPTTGATRGRGRIRRGRRSDRLPLAQDALRRPYHRVTPAAPDWVVHLEERRLVKEQGIAAALQELNATLHGMREAMESVAQGLQGITGQLDS